MSHSGSTIFNISFSQRFLLVNMSYFSTYFTLWCFIPFSIYYHHCYVLSSLFTINILFTICHFSIRPFVLKIYFDFICPHKEEVLQRMRQEREKCTQCMPVYKVSTFRREGHSILIYTPWVRPLYFCTQCTVVIPFILLLPSQRYVPLVRWLKWRMDNEMWERKWKENVFLGPQSLVFWKRNCNVLAVEPGSSSAGPPLLCAYCNVGAVRFCSSGIRSRFLFLFLFS
jgi:hypothetical protein